MDLTDSCCRRRLIAECEKRLQELWSENNFSRVEASTEIRLLFDRFFGALDRIEFTSDKIWFCGSLNDGMNHVSENALPYFSTCLLLLATNLGDDQYFDRLMTRMGDFFKDSRTIISLLMENDERLFYTLLSLIKLSKKFKLPERFDPLLLGLTLLCEIEFSESVFIDWLCSELVALSFAMQFFKLLCLDFPRVFPTLVSINQANAGKPVQMNSTTDLGDGDVVATFTISELHGDQPVKKTQRIVARNRASTSSISQAPSPIYDFDNFVGFIVRLLSSLESLQAKNLMPFNATPLVNVVKQVDDLTD